LNGRARPGATQMAGARKRINPPAPWTTQRRIRRRKEYSPARASNRKRPRQGTFSIETVGRELNPPSPSATTGTADNHLSIMAGFHNQFQESVAAQLVCAHPCSELRIMTGGGKLRSYGRGYVVRERRTGDKLPACRQAGAATVWSEMYCY
jgi:hypothetical protein